MTINVDQEASRAAREARERATNGGFQQLAASLRPLQQSQAGDVPKRYALPFRRAVLGDSGAKASIKAFCQRCMGYEDLPASVRDCTDRVCPLWMKRPYQPKPVAEG